MTSQLLTACLEDLEARIDEQQEESQHQAWKDFLDDRCESDIFVPPSRKPCPSKVDWPEPAINDAIRDVDAMLLQQFRECSCTLDGGNTIMCVRSNYGTGIMATLFGCELFIMDDELETLPTAVSLGSAEKVKPLLDTGVPDIRSRLGGRVFEAAERFCEVMRKYPKIGRWVAHYHPDLQGPIDVAEVVWGSGIFYAFYDDTQLLRDFLELVTQTYEKFMRAWLDLVPHSLDYSAHWGMMQKGIAMLRNDSLMNLSPETYVEFIRPLDQRLFDAFGGAGGQHFCGRGDHFIEQMSEMKGLSVIAMSQPHLNDMEKIYRNTVDKGIKLIGFDRATAENASRPLRGQVHCY